MKIENIENADVLLHELYRVRRNIEAIEHCTALLQLIHVMDDETHKELIPAFDIVKSKAAEIMKQKEQNIIKELSLL